MPFDFQRARPLLQSGNLANLFVEELGWEPCRQKLTLRAGETDFVFTAIAEKRGFTAWLCAGADASLPDHTTRLKLDRALTQTSFEHLNRVTAQLASRRNELVAALADEVFIAHAAAGGHLESLTRRLRLWGIPLIKP
jgi:hypothetical protein